VRGLHLNNILLATSKGRVETRSTTARLVTPDQEYFRLRTEKDKGQETTNPHIIAQRHINLGLLTTASTINLILANLKVPVTEEF